jgi:hypothetical protein
MRRPRPPIKVDRSPAEPVSRRVSTGAGVCDKPRPHLGDASALSGRIPVPFIWGPGGVFDAA